MHSYPPIAHSAPDDDRASILTAVAPSRRSEDDLMVGRTPSPTPSEARELASGAVDWQALGSWSFWFRREWLWYYVALAVILVATTLVTVFHSQIVAWLTPAAKWLHDTNAGWLVPIAVLFVLSFPPLFGHEIVAILCGLVWGLWLGFAIVAAGTLLGEIGNFYAFKYCCRARGVKLERTSIPYACLSKVVRDGGFKIALIARLSAIPGHFTTAIFSTCGMGIIVFTIAAILSMPKQVVVVYLGVILEQSNNGPTDKKSRIVSDIFLVVTIIITSVAMWYILRQMNKVKPDVIYKRRKARQAKFSRAGLGHHATASETTIVFDTTDLQPKGFGGGGDLDDRVYHKEIEAPQPIRPLSLSQRPLDFGGRGSTSPPRPYHSRSSRAAREEGGDDVGWDMGAQLYSDNPYHHGYNARSDHLNT